MSFVGVGPVMVPSVPSSYSTMNVVGLRGREQVLSDVTIAVASY